MTVTAGDNTPAQTFIRALYVVGTPHLQSPYVHLRDTEWTLLILRTGPTALARHCAPLLPHLTPDERDGWFTPWRVPAGAENLWDHINPDTVLWEHTIKPAHIPPPHIAAIADRIIRNLHN